MSKVAKATIGLMIVTILAKILGFCREIVMASIYGAGSYTDAYLIALNIPNVIFAAIGSAIATTFIPIYYDVEEKQGNLKANEFTNNITSVIAVLCIILTSLSFIFIKPLVKLFALGLDSSALNLAIKFSRILVLSMVFMGLRAILTSYLQIKGEFVIPGIVSLPKNIIIIMSMLSSPILGPDAIVYGTLIGIISEFMFQLPFAINKNYKYRPYININDNQLKKMVVLVAPVLIGVAANQVNAMIDRSLATTLVEGSATALNYANKLNEFVMALFVTVISTVIYPVLSKLNSKSNRNEFENIITTSMNSAILLVIPISLGAITFSNPIVRLLFQRGEFDIQDTQMTAIALNFYALGLIAFGLKDILTRVFYSIQDTKTPVQNGLIVIGLNILLNTILVKVMGIGGLALASSISATIGVILLFIALNKKIGYFGQKKIFKTLLKSIIASLFMAVISNIIYNFIYNFIQSNAISLIIAVFVGILVYITAIIFLRIEEVKNINEILKYKIVKKGTVN